jgi:hypothetical protein
MRYHKCGYILTGKWYLFIKILFKNIELVLKVFLVVKSVKTFVSAVIKLQVTNFAQNSQSLRYRSCCRNIEKKSNKKTQQKPQTL